MTHVYYFFFFARVLLDLDAPCCHDTYRLTLVVSFYLFWW